MNQDQFAARRRGQWQELSDILSGMQQRGARRLSLQQAQRLGTLYRRTASDLAYARTYFPGTRTVEYLNQLVSQAHTAIYAEEPQRLRSLLLFFRYEVPEMIRRHWKQVALAAGLMGLGGLIGFVAVLFDPQLADALIPASVLEQVVTPQERFNFAEGARPVIGTAIMLNNIRVGVLGFALGVTLGIGTGVVLFYNGLMIGAVAAQAARMGLSATLWAYLLTHGTLELTAIFICGAAGFVMGWPIVNPGGLPRGEAVSRGARKAVIMVMGAVLFFVAAAVLEGMVTPRRDLSDGAKYLIALATGVAGLAYLLLPPRPARPRQEKSATPAPAP